MDLLAELGRLPGFSCAAGLNLNATVALLGAIALFATAIIRAFRRRFGRRGSAAPPAGAATMSAGFLAAAMIAGLGAQQPPQGQEQPPPRPVFRAGANFVRVDVFATKDGQAVADLKAEDFEVFEDGVLQKIDTFEHVQIQTGGAPSARVEPRSIRESREMAADPRARVFVLFLDTWHMRQSSGYNVRRPLINLLQRVIGDEDLVAIMRPQMAASDIMFTRRTDQLAALLQNALPLNLGQRDRLIKDDPVEQLYEYCYPVTSMEPGNATSGIAREMIERRREKQSIDAMADLVVHLDGLREERKAILLVSEGWLLFRENRALAEISKPNVPGIGVGPTGRLDTTDRNNPYGSRLADCDRDRINLANLDNERRFRDLLDEANRANATFYPIDPRGLSVFDTDIGPNAPPPPAVDAAMLRNRLDSLKTAASNTDGIAVINSNDIDGGLRRVVADLTSYYLMGYSSTNGKFDGRFRAIRVRAKRPGVEIRARRGYRAPTEAEIAARAAGAAPPVVSEEAAALTRALSSLDAVRPNVPFRLQVSPGWWTPPGSAAAGKVPEAEAALWIYGEIDTRRPGGEDWSQGGQIDIAILSATGEVVTSYAVPLAPGNRSFSSRFPRSEDDVWLDPGTYAVRVRVKPATGGLPSTDTMRFELPKAPGADALRLGLPVYTRRGPSTGNKEVTTADLQFRRTDRLVVEASVTVKPDSATAELLDRGGKRLAVPVPVTVVDREGVVWVRGEAGLAALAAGDYVVRLAVTRGGETRQALAPFRIVP